MSTKTKTVPTQNQVDEYTNFINGTTSNCSITTMLIMLQTVNDEGKCKLPTLKFNPITLQVTKVTRQSQGYKTSTVDEDLLTLLKEAHKDNQFGITKYQIAEFAEESKDDKTYMSSLLGRLQRLRNPNRPEGERVSMVLSMDNVGKTTHLWAVTEELQGLERPNNIFITEGATS